MKANLIAAAVIVAALVATWFVSGKYHEDKLSASIKREVVVIHDTTHTATVVSPAVVRPPKGHLTQRESPPPLASGSPLTGMSPAELPWPSVYALDTVVAGVSEDSNTTVTIPLSVEFDPRTKTFAVDLLPIVTYTQPRLTFNTIEKRDPWYLRPLAALGTGAAVYGILKENEVIAGIGGAVAFYSLVFELP